MAEMNLRRNTILAAGFFAALLAGASPTLAGFEWKAPVASAPAASPSASPDSSMMPQGSSVLWEPQMPAQKVPGIEAMPLTSAERGSFPPGSSPDIVSGFGSDLPLLVALQQVVPQQYKTSLSPGVDSGIHVSWRGDRPWKQVLSDMLVPARLSYTLQGNRLVVRRSANSNVATSHAPASHAQVSQAALPSRKSDMIPDDMVSGKTEGKSMPPIEWQTQADSSSPIPMAPQHSTPSPVPETEVKMLPTPAPVSAPPMQKMSKATPQVKTVQSAPEAARMQQPQPSPTRIPMVMHHGETSGLLTQMPEAAQLSAAAEAPWHGVRGQTLKTVLKDWSDAAHVKLYWITDYDYKLNADIACAGNFEEAVAKLLDQFSAVKPQPYGQLHRNAETGAVLVVNTYGTYN